MRRPIQFAIIALALAALPAACNPAHPQAVTPTPPAPAPPAGTAPAPSTQDPLLAALAAQLAALKPDGSDLDPAVLDRELTRQFRYVQVDRLARPGEPNPLLLVTDGRQSETKAIVAWPDTGAWHVEMLPDWPVSLVWGRTLTGSKVHRTAERIELLLSWANAGDRKTRTVELLVMEHGHWRRAWYREPWWAYATVDLIDISEFRVRYDHFDMPNDPFAENPDAADSPHTHRIEIWKRFGDEFDRKSAIMELTPYYTLKRFLVLQDRGETDKAAALTVSPQVYRDVIAAGLRVVPKLKADIPFGKLQPITLSPLGLQISFVQSGDDWLISEVRRLPTSATGQ